MLTEGRGEVVVFLFEDEGDHLGLLFTEHQQLEQHARAGQLVLGAALQYPAVAKALVFGHHPHALEVALANMRGEVVQGLQRLFAGVDHVAEIEQGIEPWMVGLAQQLGDLVALELLMLLEIKIQVVGIGQPGQVQQVATDLVHDL
ncbi:hypothetical protein D3C79_787460 [compost metagenome]